jgi:hypothetical protein
MKKGESIKEKEEKKKKTRGTGVSPVQSFQITRRYLPHWQMPQCHMQIALFFNGKRKTENGFNYAPFLG